MAYIIKERGNESFQVLTPNSERFKVLVARGFVKEVGNCLFCFDPVTDLWVVANSDYHSLFVPTRPQTARPWNLAGRKKGLFSRIDKPAMKPARFTFEVATDQVQDLILEIAERELSFAQVYQALTDQLGLPDYRLPDKSEGL